MPSFDPEQHARPLSIAGTLAVVAGLYSGLDAGWAVALLGVALLLTACYSLQDGFLLFGPFARADTMRSARSRRTHLVRAGIALAAGAVIVFNGYDNLPYHYRTYLSRAQQTAYVNAQIIGWFAVSVGVLVPCLTVLLVSGAISEERAAKRWEVLLTTDLRGRELVFGKLLGKLWLVVEPVIVILPVLAILPVIVGVPVQLMLHFGGAVAVTVLALAGVSAAMSARATSRGGAAGGVVAFVACYLVTSASSFGIALYLSRFYPGLLDFPKSIGVKSPRVVADLVEFVNAANPMTTYLYAAVMPPPIGTAVPSLSGALRQYSAGALGVFLVGTLLACQRVRSVRDLGRTKHVLLVPIRLFNRGKPGTSVQEIRAKLRPPVTDEPLAWWTFCRVGIFRTGLTGPRSVARAFAVFAGVLLSSYAVDEIGQMTLYPWLRGIGLPVDVWVASSAMRGLVTLAVPGVCALTLLIPLIAATQTIANERSGDTLDSLRLTPLTAREMLQQMRAGCMATNRLLLLSWSLPTTAAVVTGFYRPLTAVILALMALVLASPLVSFALYCSVWASTPARAVRNLIFGGAVWHYLLLIAGGVTFLGMSALLDVDVDKLISFRTDPMEFLLPTGPEWGRRRRTLRGDLATIGITAVIVGLYWLLGRWVFRCAVGRFAKSRDATA